MMDVTPTHYGEKNLVENVLPEFDHETLQQMMLDSIYMKDRMEEWAPSQNDLKIQIRSVKDTACFRIRFSFPVFLLFHLSTSHLKRIHGYYKYHDDAYHAGFLPTYNCNLNHLTILKTFKKTRTWFRSLKEETEDYVCKKFLNDMGERMEQSSLNFLLQNSAREQAVSADDAKKVNLCFEFLCWNLPTTERNYTNSAIHSFIYHSSKRIFSFHRVYKTLVKLLDIDHRRYRYENRQERFQYVHGIAEIMFQDGDRIHEMVGDVIIAEPDASRLKKGDLINCLIDKAVSGKDQASSPWIITGVIGNPIPQSDVKPLITFSMWKNMQKIDASSKFSEVGTLHELKTNVKTLIDSNRNMFENKTSDFDHNFNNSLDALHPIVTLKDNVVYHIPPPLVSYMLWKKLNLFGNRDELVRFLQLVDLIKPRPSFDIFMKLRTSELGKQLQSGSCRDKWESIVRDLPRVANRIIYARIFSRPSSSLFQDLS